MKLILYLLCFRLRSWKLITTPLPKDSETQEMGNEKKGRQYVLLSECIPLFFFFCNKDIPVWIYTYLDLISYVIHRYKPFTISSMHETESKADRDCADSDDSCEQPSTSDPFYSPRELVSSPLMSTPTCQGGLTYTPLSCLYGNVYEVFYRTNC